MPHRFLEDLDPLTILPADFGVRAAVSLTDVNKAL